MNMSGIADMADLLAAAGVILSLVFVGLELRSSNRETRLSNWRQILDQLVAFKGRATDPELARLIVDGNADYSALNDAQKLSYGMYLEQGIHIIGNFPKHMSSVPGQFEGLEDAVNNLMRDLLDHPGARAWWIESRERHRFMPATEKGINSLLGLEVAP